MAFVETQFPNDIAFGATGGAMFSTDIIETFGGWEQRNINWSEARGQWNVGSGIKAQAQLDTLIAFFRARRGKAIGFRFKDWSDYQASDQVIGTGDGVETDFQLVKSYTSGSVTVDRVINKPVAGTVRIFKDAVEQMSGWTVDTATGLVTFTSAPANGVVITAIFQFDVPVRFDTDQIEVNMESYQVGSWNNIPLVELRV
jgi:uncharacterized protein (TIGR02217 family)